VGADVKEDYFLGVDEFEHDSGVIINGEGVVTVELACQGVGFETRGVGILLEDFFFGGGFFYG
jgi:hypothetical protein